MIYVILIFGNDGGIDDVIARDLRRQRDFRNRSSSLNYYDDTDIIVGYQLNRRSIMHIIDALAISLGRPTRRSKSLSTTFTSVQGLEISCFGNSTGDDW
jgi:hypothetical protein